MLRPMSRMQDREIEELVTRLRATLESATDFMDVWHLYGELIERPHYMRMGRAEVDETIERLLEASADRALQRGGKLDKLEHSGMRHIPELALFHGRFELAGYHGLWFYCTDVKQGLLALKTSPLARGTHLVRFSPIELEGPAWPQAGRGQA
jgi:hypothetical protein